MANGGGVPISNNETGFTPGASAISLRGLGPQATLVLIDGRRIAPYPIGNGGTSSFFDLRSIPEAAIESIEILKDGASTTYGADAVAGVVNIKLRHDYKGAEATVEYGNTLDKDASLYRASVLFGVGDGNTNVSGVMNFFHQNSIFNHDRGYSHRPPFLSSNSTPENLQLTFECSRRQRRRSCPGAALAPGDIFFGHAPFGSNGRLRHRLIPIRLVDRLCSTSTVLRAPSQSRRTMVDLLTSITRSSENKWSFTEICIYQNTTSHGELAPGATG